MVLSQEDGFMRKARKSSGKEVTDLNQLFLGFLGLEEPWFIQSIEWDPLEGRVDLHVSFREGTRFPCPQCGGSHPVHDCLERTWRHLNLFGPSSSRMGCFRTGPLRSDEVGVQC